MLITPRILLKEDKPKGLLLVTNMLIDLLQSIQPFFHYRNVYISRYKFSLSGRVSVCLNPITVKTAEPTRPKFCVGPYMAPGKVHGQSDFKYVILKYFYLKLFNFVKFRKCSKIFFEIRK